MRFQLIKLYVSLRRYRQNEIMLGRTEMPSVAIFIDHKTSSTISLATKHSEKYSHRLSIRYAAARLVTSEIVLTTRLSVFNARRRK